MSLTTKTRETMNLNVVEQRVRSVLVAGSILFLGACAAGPQVTVNQPLSGSADAPYQKILVVALFSSFDSRRYLEKEVSDRLNALGISAVPSTSMMDTRTPVVAQTFIDMVDDIGADAVLLTQITSHGAEASAESARPEATMNYWPTYYYNVFEVQLTEYVEPPRINIEHSLVLATEVISVQTRDPVWAIDSISKFVEIEEDGRDYGIYTQEADAIVNRMTRDGLVEKP